MAIYCKLINTLFTTEDTNYIAYFSNVKKLEDIRIDDVIFIYESEKGYYHKVKVSDVTTRPFLNNGKIAVYLKIGSRLSLKIISDYMITEQL